MAANAFRILTLPKARVMVFSVKAKPSKPPKPDAETIGGKMLAEIRPVASKMTDAEREALMAEGMQLVYGHDVAKKTARRG